MATEPPWFAKYQPKTMVGVVGQSSGLSKLAFFVQRFPMKKKALLIHGPPGVGKTAAVYALAAEKDYEVVELNSSDFRNAAAIEEVISTASTQMSLFSSKKLILIDELDGISGTADRGATKAIIAAIKETKHPFVLIANDPWVPKFKTLRLYCELNEFPVVKTADIVSVLRKICIRQELGFEDVALTKIATAANGDVRAAINDLQAVTTGKEKLTLQDVTSGNRDYEEKIFNALRLIFKSFDTTTAINSVSDLSMEPSLLTYWLDQNIPVEYKLPQELRNAYRSLADADIFNSRITRRQYWGFLRYVNFFLSAGIQQAKVQARPSFQNYAKPDMRNVFIRAAKRKKAKGIAEALKGDLHASTRVVQKDILPYLNYMRDANPEWGKEIDAMLGV